MAVGSYAGAVGAVVGKLAIFGTLLDALAGAKLPGAKPEFSPSGVSGDAGENSERKFACAASALSVEVLKGFGGSGGTLKVEGTEVNLEADDSVPCKFSLLGAAKVVSSEDVSTSAVWSTDVAVYGECSGPASVVVMSAGSEGLGSANTSATASGLGRAMLGKGGMVLWRIGGMVGLYGLFCAAAELWLSGGGITGTFVKLLLAVLSV